MPTLAPQPTCWYFHLSFSGASRDIQFLCFSILIWILFQDWTVIVLQFSLVYVRLLSWFPASLFYFKFFTFLKLSPFCCYSIPTVFTIKRLFAGRVFADLWLHFHSLLLMNAVRFWVAPLIYQAIADTARSAGCFEEMKERIQQS